MGAQCAVAACLQMHTRYQRTLLSAMPSQTLISGPDHWQLCICMIILPCDLSLHRAYNCMMPIAAHLLILGMAQSCNLTYLKRGHACA